MFYKQQNARVAFCLLLSLCCVYIENCVAWELDQVPVRARNGKLFENLQSKTEIGRNLRGTNDFETFQYTQFIDHFNHSQGTFSQRYYVDSSSFAPTSNRVILYISGEAPCEGPPTGYVKQMAKRSGALLLALEHRFYGESVPVNLENENIRFLKVEQAMEDLASFITWYKQNRLSSSTQNAKWLVVGGSYSGALSSWFRTIHPELADAAWSSSGVVNPILNFYEFDQAIAESVGAECASAIHDHLNAFVIALENDASPNPKTLFGLDTEMNTTDFYYMLTDAAVMAVQYNNKDKLCSHLLPIPAPSDRIPNYVEFVKSYYGDKFAHDCFYDTRCLSDTSQSARWQPTARAWRWQKCSELAYFQVAPEKNSIRPTSIDLDYHLLQCQQIFDNATMTPNTEAIIERYGSIHPETKGATKIFYSNGSDDPWRKACIQDTISNSLQEYTAQCDGCGHCADLHAPLSSDPANLVRQRVLEASFFANFL